MTVRPGSNASSETQGQLVGTGKSLNGREKNSGEEKASRRVRAPRDKGQLVGAGKSLNEREKNSGEEKSSIRVRAPGDKVLTDQFQTVGAVLASDWCQKIFVFFLPNAVLHMSRIECKWKKKPSFDSAHVKCGV